MALQVTISGVVFPPENYYVGPFKSSEGAYYVILLDSSDTSLIEAWKATDPTSSFSEQNGANKPNLTNLVRSLWVCQVSDVLHIAAQEASTGRVSYRSFDMASDFWSLEPNETVETPAQAPDAMSVSIGIRSDGDVIILYNGDTDAVKGNPYQRVDYARKEGSTWTTGVAVDNAGSVNWYGSVVVLGSSDRMHFFFSSYTANDAYQRCLTSANALETFPSSFDTDISATKHAYVNGVHWTSGGNEKVRCLYKDGDDTGAVAKLTSADAPTVTVTANAVDAVAAGNNPICGMALQTNVQHIMLARSSDADLYRDYTGADDDTWANADDVMVLEVVTINAISVNVYLRGSATELAYVYDDNGTIKYNEVQLAAGGPTEVSLAGAQPASTGVLHWLSKNKLSGSQPNSTGAISASRLLSACVAGNQPAATGGFALIKYQISLAGAQPNSTGSLGLAAQIALAGTQPAASGSLSVKYLIALSGSQPSATGSIAAIALLFATLTGAQPSATGSLTVKYLIALSGSQPNATGGLTQEYKIALAGAQPAASGSLSLITYVALAGAQPAPSGTIVGKYLIALAGNQPSASGLLSLIGYTALAGSQPNATGALVVQYKISLVGNQPAASGAISYQYLISLSGSQPTPTGALGFLAYISLAGNQPSAAGLLIALYQIALAG